MIKRLNLFDKLLLMASLLGLVLTGYVLSHEDLIIQKLLPDRFNAKEIGKITETKNDSRRRLSQSLTWYPTSTNNALYHGDSLFTGAESELELSVNESKILHLNPNSLVVLQSLNNEIVFNLKLGSGTFKSLDNQPIKILSRGVLSVIKFAKPGIEVSAEKDLNKQLQFSSNINGAEIETEGKTIVIPSKEIIAAQPDPVPPSAPQLEESLPDVKAEGSEFPEAPAVRDVEVKIAVKAKPDKKNKTPSPPVEAAKINPVEVPALISPTDKTTLVNFNPKEIESTLFVWKKIELATNYEIQFAADYDFKNVLQSQKISTNQYILKILLGSNLVYWRVRAGQKDTFSEWSKTRVFKVQVSNE